MKIKIELKNIDEFNKLVEQLKKNIDEFNKLVEQLKKDVDKVKNFKFDIVTNQCEHIQDKQN